MTDLDLNERKEQVESSLDLIGEHLTSTVEDILHDGLPNGAEEEMGFDEQLVIDIGRAVTRWQKRNEGKLIK